MERSKVAEEVKLLRDKGKSWGEVSKELQGRGIVGPRSGKPFTTQYLSSQFGGRTKKAKKAPQLKAAATREVTAPPTVKHGSLSALVARVQADLARIQDIIK